MRWFVLSLFLLLGSCYAPPSGAVLVDEGLRTTTLETFAGYREPVSCPDVETVFFVSVADTVPLCHAEVASCVLVRSGSFRHSVVVVWNNYDQVRTDRLIIHEILHAARGCWVLAEPSEYSARYSVGESERCHVRTAQDPYHCDTELWRTIQPAATAQYENLP